MNFEQALLGAVVALGGSVAVLFKLGVSTFRKIERKLDACEQDRVKLWEKMTEIESHQ